MTPEQYVDSYMRTSRRRLIVRPLPPRDRCGVYFGERDDSALHGTRGAICVRVANHPPISVDGVGHSSTVDMTPAERRADLLQVVSETYAVTMVVAALAGHVR